MLKKTTLKNKNSKLKKTPLKANSNGLKKSSSLKIKKTEGLKKTVDLKPGEKELKKQNEKSKAAWISIRSEVLNRDNHKCVVCGKNATQVHHIHLRSKRKDLIYEINNLVSLCDKHHDHSSEDGIERVNRRIAVVKNITLEELLKFAETKKEGD